VSLTSSRLTFSAATPRRCLDAAAAAAALGAEGAPAPPPAAPACDAMRLPGLTHVTTPQSRLAEALEVVMAQASAGRGPGLAALVVGARDCGCADPRGQGLMRTARRCLGWLRPLAAALEGGALGRLERLDLGLHLPSTGFEEPTALSEMVTALTAAQAHGRECLPALRRLRLSVWTPVLEDSSKDLRPLLTAFGVRRVRVLDLDLFGVDLWWVGVMVVVVVMMMMDECDDDDG
jgi:hypothetical protein